MDQLNHQRLESLSAMGGFNRQSLGSLGKLDSLGKLGGPLLQRTCDTGGQDQYGCLHMHPATG